MTDNRGVTSVLALDVGARRIGVAVASRATRLPRPLTTLLFDETFWETLQKIIADERVDTLVVGYPRGLQGQRTAQTASIEDFIETLSTHFEFSIKLQDEALTSQRAKAELDARSKPYEKEAIDALAATYILEDWLASQSLPQVAASKGVSA